MYPAWDVFANSSTFCPIKPSFIQSTISHDNVFFRYINEWEVEVSCSWGDHGLQSLQITLFPPWKTVFYKGTLDETVFTPRLYLG